MLDQNQVHEIVGMTAYDSDGDKIGKVGEVYLDDQTGQASWASVNTGLFGMNESFIPLHDATMTSDGVQIPVDKDHVKDAPNVADDGHLSPDDERTLYGHYGLTYDTVSGTADATQDSTVETGTGYDTSGPETDDAMTVSEERLRVGTQTHESGRVRLRKYVVTENVTQTVPVRREKAVLERVPVTDENRDAATAGADISDEEHEVVLHEERPVVEKTVEAVERVRLGTQEVQGDETVTESVRKEQVETEGDLEPSTAS